MIAEGNLAASHVGDIDGTDSSGSVSGGLVESGSESCTVGDLVELGGVEVVQEDVEAESVLDDGEGVFGSESGHGAVVQNEDSDGIAAVNFAVELCLGEVAIEEAVVRKGREDLCDIVGVGGEGHERESEEQEVHCAH
ncbi:hypothetical protein U1Q18_036031, partial [Sarracenia purpurea var. burkii]